MNLLLLFCALVIALAVFGTRFSAKSGIPTLLIFIVLGMLAGSDGILKIEFNDYGISEKICSAALIFIMFHGGFGTKWSMAKPVALKAILLSSVGVVLTAFFTGLFCNLALGLSLLDSLLIGSVLSSTDAATVFSILKSRKLSLKYNTSSLLELESGSNDPTAYMLVTIFIMLKQNPGSVTAWYLVYSVFAQIAFAFLIGVGMAYAIFHILKHFSFSSGFEPLLILSASIASYALSALVGGNGYLSTYITGIILGNKEIDHKKELVNFFDTFEGMMQILIFFLLGLLSFPSQLAGVAPRGLLVALFMTFIARPLVVFLIMAPFGSKFAQQQVISWAGLRGASSIVFAIVVTVSETFTADSIFNIVFFVVLFSIMLQGTFLPLISKRTGMIDEKGDVLKTFNDYEEVENIEFVPMHLDGANSWVNRKIKDITLPPSTIIAAIERDGQPLVPRGATELKENDQIILGIEKPSIKTNIDLHEQTISEDDPWCGKMLKDINLPKGLVLIIIRDGKNIIPSGDTLIEANDCLVINYGD